ncbi:hypothetical protein FHH43_01535 [Clostridium perfringens]|nr:hypothetical protein [Clostridium perfringens]
MSNKNNEIIMPTWRDNQTPVNAANLNSMVQSINQKGDDIEIISQAMALLNESKFDKVVLEGNNLKFYAKEIELFSITLPTGSGGSGVPGQDGQDGREIELRKGTTHIEWRYVGDSNWTSLVSLEELRGDNGKDGINGITPNIQIGTVTTVEHNQNATVTRRGTNEEPVFDFAIPKGAPAVNDGSGGSVDLSAYQTKTDETLNTEDKTIPGAINEIASDTSQNKDDIIKINRGKSLNSNEGVVTFYLDDAYKSDMNIVLPKAKELGIPLTICAIYSNLENPSFLSLEELKRLEDEEKWEIHAHTINHLDLSTLSYEDQEYEIGESAKLFRKQGLKVDGICYPLGKFNADTLKITRKYFNVGMGSFPTYNEDILDTYNIKRVLTDSKTLDELKQIVDNLGDKWVVFYSHTNIFHSNAEVREKYFSIMEYVKEKNIKTKVVKDVLKERANILDYGDSYYDYNYFKIGSNGKFDLKQIPIIFDSENNPIVNQKTIQEFEKNKVTINVYNHTNKSDIPVDSGLGVLKTYCLFTKEGNYSGCYQEFFGYMGSNATRYYSQQENGWTDWQIDNVFITSNLSIKNETSITDFPKGRIITKSFISGQTNIPISSGIGTLITSRLSPNDILNYQIWHPYNDDSIYKRRWTSSGWGEWVVYTVTKKQQKTLDFGTIPAYSTKDISFEMQGVMQSSVCSVSAVSGMLAGLTITAFCATGGNVTIRIANITNSEKAVGSRPFVVTIS